MNEKVCTGGGGGGCMKSISINGNNGNENSSYTVLSLHDDETVLMLVPT